ncbi:MAG: SMC family ATPase [Candidatus Thorarchaeota archaeon]|nr:SMC family ATPase [Candidatus Thorarchaeota archaeon]
MKIESIELENIRSYENVKIDFPDGSVLLSGDIGCGKSTLLLATEFALFGIRRGELSGTSLLRRGKKRGSVKLTFSIDNMEIVIKRALQRTASKISQDSGSMIVDGVEQELTPTEMKAHILKHLGYPQELLDKQKSLLYRYTVYTPQEEMKRIMWAKPDERLDSLRKVFGVDRYQIIVENLEQFLVSLRAKKRELKGIHRDLDAKLEEQSKLRGELRKTNQNIGKYEQEESRINEELKKWKKEKDGIENQIKRYNNLQIDLAKKQGLLKNEETRLEGVNKQLIEYKNSIDEIDSLQSPTTLSEKELEDQIEALEKRAVKCIENPRDESEIIDALLDKIESVAETLDNIEIRHTDTKAATRNLKNVRKELKAAGDICPICGKSLEKAHKDMKMTEYQAELDGFQKEQDKLKIEFDNLTNENKELSEKLKQKREELVKTIREEKKQSERMLTALQKYSEKVGKRDDLISNAVMAESASETLTHEIERLGISIGKLETQIEKMKGVEHTREEIEKQIGRVQGEFSKIEKQLATHRETKKQFNNQIKGLNQEIKQKKKARAFETKLESIETWLGTHLINLAGTIEKHYMVDLKRKFDPMFSQWFNLLIADEQLDVRIDDEFTPIIEQEGYEAEYENLSGGESASVALAYRLALNKVINTMVDDIKTKDFIILDEPTDGFSNDQMDKIRDVINELGVKQTIIVSHEPKIESFMDNIIRITKNDGISTILE